MDVVLRRFNEQSSGELEWVLRRHCSISPLQLALAFGSVALLSGVIAAAFASFGAWGVIPFAGLEIFALAVAYVVYARHTGDFERIVLAPGRLVVEVVAKNARGACGVRDRLRLQSVLMNRNLFC